MTVTYVIDLDCSDCGGEGYVYYVEGEREVERSCPACVLRDRGVNPDQIAGESSSGDAEAAAEGRPCSPATFPAVQEGADSSGVVAAAGGTDGLNPLRPGSPSVPESKRGAA